MSMTNIVLLATSLATTEQSAVVGQTNGMAIVRHWRSVIENQTQAAVVKRFLRKDRVLFTDTKAVVRFQTNWEERIPISIAIVPPPFDQPVSNVRVPPARPAEVSRPQPARTNVVQRPAPAATNRPPQRALSPLERRQRLGTNAPSGADAVSKSNVVKPAGRP